MMSKHIPTVALGAFLAGAFLLLGAAHSTGQNKGTPPPPPTPPAQPGQPGTRPMPPMPPDKDKAKPAVPDPNQGKDKTPPNPATPATPSDKASDKALQTPSRTGGTPSRQPSGPLPQQAQTMMNSLGTMNLQNVTTT